MKLFVIIAALAAFLTASPIDSSPDSLPADVLHNSVDIHDPANFSPNGTYYSPTGVQIAEVTIALSKERAHVGDLYGPSLYGAVWQGLVSVCTDKDGHCSGEKFVFSIPVVEHDRLLHHKLVFSVVGSQYLANPQIRNLLIGLVASAFQRTSEDGKNCYTEVWGIQKHRMYMCSVGNRVHARIGYWYMTVEVASPSTRGYYDCPAVVQSVKQSINNLLPELDPVFNHRPTTDAWCE